MMSRSRSPCGSVHAIVGENGAGKSTLGRIVAGALSADGGRMLLDGAPTSFRSPREALDHGVAAIAQEPSLVPQLTVAENVWLGAEPQALRVRPASSPAEGLRGAGRPRRLRPSRPGARRHAENGRATEDGDPAGTLARGADHRHGRAVGGAQRARDGPAARHRPLAGPRRQRRSCSSPTSCAKSSSSPTRSPSSVTARSFEHRRLPTRPRLRSSRRCSGAR